MKDKKKYYRLGSPAAAVVATELMKDKDIRSDVKHGVRKGFSIVGTTFKVIGIGIGITILAVATKNIATKIKENRRAKKSAKQDAEGLDKSQLTKKDSWYLSAVSDLEAAMELNTRCMSDSTRNYNETSIQSILNECGNQHDWMQLCKMFGARSGKTYTGETEPRTLRHWLGYDDESDVKAYNAILASKGVPSDKQLRVNG